MRSPYPVLALAMVAGACSSGSARLQTTEAGAPDTRSDSSGTGGSSGHVSVLQHHNNASRDGFYVDPALSRTAIANLHVDPAFAGATISGPTYAQPLYLAGANGGPDLVILATEHNH